MLTRLITIAGLYAVFGCVQAHADPISLLICADLPYSDLSKIEILLESDRPDQALVIVERDPRGIIRTSSLDRHAWAKRQVVLTVGLLEYTMDQWLFTRNGSQYAEFIQCLETQERARPRS